MPCGCGKKAKLPTRTARVSAAAPVEPVDPVAYKNVSDGTLTSRNPRLNIKPGDVVALDPATVNHTARGWIRRGQLTLA